MKGRSIPLSPARRLVLEHCRLAQGVPKGALRGDLALDAVAAARSAAGAARPPWTAIMAKAMALAAREVPELRRIYVKLPTPRLYEVPESVAAIVVERLLAGEPALFYGRVKAPDALPLAGIAARVREAKEAPVEEVADFRAALLVSRLPQPLRSAVVWTGRNLGRQVPNRFGTFGVTAVAAGGTVFSRVVTHWTSCLSYGAIDRSGQVEAYLTFDHRVMDGAAAVRAFQALAAALEGPVLAELRALDRAEVAVRIAARG
ncbi:MAG: 2-oxo acid dehydrogenase subunit E2 [Acetobacteraceae bacterium]|nr:2-oxo acid dehydrogenase subunit E2 [Acetobacteraceae bacterium]